MKTATLITRQEQRNEWGSGEAHTSLLAGALCIQSSMVRPSHADFLLDHVIDEPLIAFLGQYIVVHLHSPFTRRFECLSRCNRASLRRDLFRPTHTSC
jgi:hypothetical protein